MATISLTIKPELVSQALQMFKELYPIPTNEKDEPIYTDAQWPKQCIINNVKRDFKRWKQRKDMDAAKAAVEVSKDFIE